MRSRAWLRGGARVVALLGVLLAVLAVRVVTASRAELERGDRAQERGDVDAAIVAYRRAARWYAPASPYPPAALDRLASLAETADENADPETAIAAWRSMRGAILAARSLTVPFPDRRARAEREIVRLVGEQANDAGQEDARRRAAEAYARPIDPHPGFTVLLLLGWIGWVTGAFLFAQRAIDEEDRIQPGPARVLGTIVVLGFGMFVIGMALA
ncbi:MAG: hypothetical protein AB8I08_05120 [Sandaracinaceae bacterium]